MPDAIIDDADSYSEASAQRSAGQRHRTRAIVMQCLYEADAVKHNAAEALGGHAAGAELPLMDEGFARSLIDNIVAHAAEIDDVITRLAPDWPISQMAVVDRNILRIAVYEIMFSLDTPAKVVINEAVELAKAFGGDGAPRFVNGVLGSVMEVLANYSQLVEHGSRR